MLAIDRIAYTSSLSNVSVKEKLLFIMLPMLVALFASSNMLNLAIILAICPITLYFSHISWQAYLRLLLLPVGFIILSIITICIIPAASAHGQILLTFSLFSESYALSWDSIQSGLQLLSKSLAAISCLYFLALNTPLNSLLAYLQNLGVSSLLLTLMEFIYRFIFILYEQAGVIHTAQASRLGHSGFFRSIRAYYQLFTYVFLRSLGRIERINNALISRGFDNSFHHLAHTQEHSPQLRRLTLICTLLLIIGYTLERGWL